MSTPPVPPNGAEQHHGDQKPAPEQAGPGQERPEPGRPERQPQALQQQPPAYGQQSGPQQSPAGPGDQGAPGARPAPRYGQYAPGFGEGQQPPASGQQGGYGQQPPAYGQQGGYGQPWQQPAVPGYGAPGYGAPGYGAPSPEAQRTAVRRASLLVFITAAAEVLIGLFATLATLNTPTSALRNLFDNAGGASSGITFEQFHQIISTFVWLAMAGVVVNAAVLVLCGVFLMRGRRWARILGTVFLCLTLGAFLAGGFFSLITIGLAVASIVLLFRPAVTAFLAAQNQFANPYTTPKGPTFGNPYGQ